jgi:hypothetical protein
MYLIHLSHVFHALPLLLQQLLEDAVQLQIGGRRDVIVELQKFCQLIFILKVKRFEFDEENIKELKKGF